MARNDTEEGRGKQILAGAAILAANTVLVCGLLVGWRMIPGWVGESFGMLAGILSTPFFMEGSFVIMGFLIVVGLNTWRRRNEGDEFVEFETGGDDGSGDLGSK